MKNNNHTAGLLRATKSEENRLDTIVDVHGSRVAILHNEGFNFEPNEQEGNCRRFVACWNAFDGIPTNDIEGSNRWADWLNEKSENATLRAKVEILQGAYDTAKDHANALSAENARLRDALEGVLRVAIFSQTKFSEMNNNEHTPGPWKVGTALDCGNALAVFDARAEIGNTKDQHRCICLISELHNIDEQDEANARLIAAAPEMLKALEMIENLQSKTRICFDASDAESMWDTLQEVFIIASNPIAKLYKAI